MSSKLRSISALWKQGWNEIPEVMITTIIGAGSICGLMAMAYRLIHLENKTYRYKLYYTIMRPDDPKVKQLWRKPESPPFTSTP